MKKIIIFLGAALAAFCSCFNLDTELTGEVGSSTMWTTPEFAKAGMDGILKYAYTQMSNSSEGAIFTYPNTHCCNRPGMERRGFTSAGVYDCNDRRETPNAGIADFSDEWRSCYEAIHSCNTALERLGDAHLDDKTYNQYMAEAKFLRAWFYFRLNVLFQGVPVYMKSVDNVDCTKGPESADSVWHVCLNDLEACLAEPDFPDNTLTTQYGRPSKGAAYGLRGMVHMWMAREATDSLDVVGAAKHYQDAVDDFSAVADCGYGLWEGEYLDFFKEANEKDHEMILPLQYSSAPGYGDYSALWFGARSTHFCHSRLHPSAMFIDTFRNADGSPFEWTEVPGLEDWNNISVEERAVFFVRDSMEFHSNPADPDNYISGWAGKKSDIILAMAGGSDATPESKEHAQQVWDTYYLDLGNEDRIHQAYLNRDPRLLQILVEPCSTVNTCSRDGGVISPKRVVWPFLRDGSGDAAGDYWPEDRVGLYYNYRKFVVFENPGFVRDCNGLDWPLMRYTDISLYKAEALCELNKLQESIDELNPILARAHMPALSLGSGLNAVADQAELRNRIREERRIELCGEGLNYFDEIRWGTIKETIFQGQDMWHQCTPWMGFVSYNFYYHEWGWPWPYPAAEVQRNPNLPRREGWIY